MLKNPAVPNKSCTLCGDTDGPFQRHHLIPREAWQPGDSKETIRCCRYCHAIIHRTLSNRELRERWNTLGLLRSHPEIPKQAKQSLQTRDGTWGIVLEHWRTKADRAWEDYQIKRGRKIY